MLFRLPIILCIAIFVFPAEAQVRSAAGDQDDRQPSFQHQQASIKADQTGRTAQSAAGQVGQRQTRDTTAARTGIEPMARIASRIQNRVQNRIRNRIDRTYDPQGNATDPFKVAEAQTQSGGLPR